MFAYRQMSLLVMAALCAGSLQAHAVDGANRSATGKSFGKLELSGKWLSPQRFGPSSAFFSAPLGEEVVSPPVRSGADTVWPVPAAASPVNARAAVTPDVEEAVAPPSARPATAAKRPVRQAPPRAAAKRAPSNPMNSYARDTQGPRRQSWPCSGGGICAWQ
jgi:hypothetical protein